MAASKHVYRTATTHVIFSRSFRKYFDCTGGDYRQQHQEHRASG